MLNNAHLSIGSTAVQSLKCKFPYMILHYILTKKYHYLPVYVFKPMLRGYLTIPTAMNQWTIHGHESRGHIKVIESPTTPQNEGDFFSLGLFHGGDQLENQHPSFTRESQWTQLDTQCDTKCPKK